MRCTEAVVMCVVIGTGRPLCRPVYIIIYALLFLFRSALVSTLATPSALRATVSLRLGHGAALTCHRHVIHYRAAASLP